ncbi:hypothetical protein [Streptomyces hoynatensis]|uniref:Type II toxin-antitoxin system RelE/ParE family toxin n=1 Tax=Streptomyces hoynatensis TaxID=1141874 RepID=A0A3A9YWY7_9ACTN|nr:hypothetical protein [Streptomyces hoynatensis]RKN40445.1 hypothetical protein D7294_18545 [Streptomyces hoynatensis]
MTDRLTYRLKYDAAAQAVHDALPGPVSELLTRGMAAACEDPLRATEPYGHEDPVMRMVVTERAFAVVLAGHRLRTITVLHISHLD